MNGYAQSSPHVHGANSVRATMLRVAAALLPALAAMIWIFGWPVLITVILASGAAIASEALMLRLRDRPLVPYVNDGSALVTGMLLGMAIPSVAPWWLTVLGASFAMIFGKHLYGGLGYNPFNPAMLGYAVLLVSFPRDMTLWPAPAGFGGLDLVTSLDLVFESGRQLDAYTSATVLDTVRTQTGLGRDIAAIRSGPTSLGLFGHAGGKGWEVVNLCLLGGGLWLLYQRVIEWRIPFAMLGTLTVMAAAFYMLDDARYTSPLFHLASGAAIMGAFFIATDPVSAATTPRGRLLYGAGIGLLIYIIRTWGGYPDAIAFAVLLMNMAAPTIDHYTRPRVFGES